MKSLYGAIEIDYSNDNWHTEEEFIIDSLFLS